jgi:hypothetical protein
MVMGPRGTGILSCKLIQEDCNSKAKLLPQKNVTPKPQIAAKGQG